MFHVIVKGEFDVFITVEDERKYSSARYCKGDMLNGSWCDSVVINHDATIERDYSEKK